MNAKIYIYTRFEGLYSGSGVSLMHLKNIDHNVEDLREITVELPEGFYISDAGNGSPELLLWHKNDKHAFSMGVNADGQPVIYDHRDSGRHIILKEVQRF